jgi:type IX secretion system PorP/SprF family membrane protein
MKGKLLGVFVIIFSLQSLAQDPQFSQFAASNTFLNPAFSGASHQQRAVLHYRNQWPEIKKAFITSSASFDTYVPDAHVGVGGRVTYDKAGSAGLSFFDAAINLAYEFKITKEWSVRAGIDFGFYQRRVDFDRLVFGDQLLRGGSNRDGIDAVNAENNNFFNFDAGGLIYNKHFWLGFSGRHLNTPNESVLQRTAQLPKKYSLHGGTRVIIKKDRKQEIKRAFWLAFQLKDQNISTQLDVGAYAEFAPVLFGLWYRGIPVNQSRSEEYVNTDALVASVGFELYQLRLVYSYDITVSKLYGNSGGSHEISIVVEWDRSQFKEAEPEAVPCPKF